MTDSVLAQLAVLPEKSTPELKQLWRELYDREPPPYSKPFLIKRLAYRIQELAHGGLSARAEAKLGALIEEEAQRLKGKHAMTPSHTRKAGRLYRYYVATDAIRQGYSECPVRSVPAAEIEEAVVAHRWKRMLEEGTYRSAGEIAQAENVTKSFVNRLIRLTLLAPDIQEAILDGRQPKGMQLDALTRVMPSKWGEQRDTVGLLSRCTARG